MSKKIEIQFFSVRLFLLLAKLLGFCNILLKFKTLTRISFNAAPGADFRPLPSNGTLRH